MPYTLRPDSRRPRIALVCDEDGQPIEYEDGVYQSRPPYRYLPSAQESRLRREIEHQFGKTHEIKGISPNPKIGRFEAKEN